MTVSNTTRNVREQGNGSKTAFDFPFKIFATTDLKVYKIVRATDAETLLVLNTDYTVSINTSTEGGTVTYVVAPTTLQDSYIKRQLPRTQQSEIPTESNFPEQTIEDIADRQAMILIEQDEEIARAVQASEFSTDPDAPSSEELAALVQDAEDAATAAAASAVAAAASASAASSSASTASTQASAAAASAVAAAASAASVAVHAKVVTFTRDTTAASGTQVVTGLGFTPKAVIFLAHESGTKEMSIGFDDATTPLAMFDNNASVADTYSHTTASIYDEVAGSNLYTGVISALGADGFTVTWTKTGSPTGTLKLIALAIG